MTLLEKLEAAVEYGYSVRISTQESPTSRMAYVGVVDCLTDDGFVVLDSHDPDEHTPPIPVGCVTDVIVLGAE
jgi:hypothetical protein